MPLHENKTFVECDHCKRLKEVDVSTYLRMDSFSISEFKDKNFNEDKRQPHIHQNGYITYFCNRICLTEWLKSILE